MTTAIILVSDCGNRLALCGTCVESLNVFARASEFVS